MWITLLNFQLLQAKEVLFIASSPAWEFNTKHGSPSLGTRLPIIREQMSDHSGLDEMELI